MTTAGEMRERVGVLSLVYDREADEYCWAEVRRVWARTAGATCFPAWASGPEG